MIFTSYPNDFWHKRKIDYFEPYNVLLAISTNITGATYDWFCAPESQIIYIKKIYLM